MVADLVVWACLNSSESLLRRALFEDTGGMYPELITRPDIKVFLPPIGGMTVYICAFYVLFVYVYFFCLGPTSLSLSPLLFSPPYRLHTTCICSSSLTRTFSISLEQSVLRNTCTTRAKS